MAATDTYPLGQFDRLFNEIQVYVPMGTERVFMLQYIQVFYHDTPDELFWSLEDVYELDEDGEPVPIPAQGDDPETAWLWDVNPNELGDPNRVDAYPEQSMLAVWYS